MSEPSNKKKILRKAIWIAVTTVIVFFYFTALNVLGRKWRESHPEVEVQRTDHDLKKGWSWKAGDDPSWSMPETSDRNWEHVLPDSMPDHYNGELGWFRLRFATDTFMRNHPLVLLIQQYGASDIYLDGRPAVSYGTPASVPGKEKKFDPHFLYFNLNLTSSDSHLLAIRYSNLDFMRFNALNTQLQPGFAVTLADRNHVIRETELERSALAFNFSLGAFLFTLALIHLLLYLFYRQAKENLFYSLFAFCYSMLFIMSNLSGTSTSPQTELFFRSAFLLFLNPLLFLSLITFVFWIYQQRFPFGGWLAVAVSAVSIGYILFGWPGLTAYFIALIWFAVFSVIIMARGTWNALREKRPGAKILATGVGIFALFLFFGISLMFFAGRLDIDLESANVYLVALLLIAIMSIPISMSIYLAYTSAKTNTNLQLKLAEVETLSAKTLEQEKEKQRILETQKETLESQVKERTAEIEEQKKVIEEKNKDITDSITYAKRIQDAILPSKDLKRELFPDSFVLFKPKDIVSGDFYYFAKAEAWNEGHHSDAKGKRIIAAVDCTGHGVPGALMSVIGNDILNQVVLENNITRPAEILQRLDAGVRHMLKKTDHGGESRDGMDIALCCFDPLPSCTQFEYAGAQRPLWIVRAGSGELEEIKADKFSIGGLLIGDKKIFTNHTVPLHKGDCVYIFSDGFADQFGGSEGKKFMSRKFKDLLVSIHSLSMPEQEKALDDAIEKWKGNTVQVDDILVIGIRG